jgi:hypothetical protein
MAAVVDGPPAEKLQDDLNKLDLNAFQQHCAQACEANAPPSPEFFAWLKLYLTKPNTFAFHRLQQKSVVSPLFFQPGARSGSCLALSRDLHVMLR